MRKKEPQAVSRCFDSVLPSGDKLKFVLKDDVQELYQGWKIYQCSDSEVSDFL